MKNSFKKFATIALSAVVLGLTFNSVQAAENKSSYTNLSSIKNIQKIKVSGNVKLILIQDAKESVQMNDSYYQKNALVQQQDGELRISSFNKETLTVIAHVNNLTDIEASDLSEVSTYGNFNLLSLNIVLNDQAKANINATTLSLTTKVNNKGNLNLSGSSDYYTAVLGNLANVKMNDFTALTSDISMTPVVTSTPVQNNDLNSILLNTIF